jgi:hypothetical protein
VYSRLWLFSSDALFIGFFRNLLRGLFGCGVFAWPFVLFLAAAILGFHRDDRWLRALSARCCWAGSQLDPAPVYQ